MTLHTILVSGVLKCITELPEEPKQSDFVEYTDVGDLFHADDYHSAFYAYQRALESAKNNAIPYEDQEMIEGLLDQHCNWRKPSPFDQPIENQIHSFEFAGRIEKDVTWLREVDEKGNQLSVTAIRLIPEVEIEPLEEPVGSFILQQSDIPGTQTYNGTYYHYSQVCVLLATPHKFTITRKPLNHG
jgi:hypothetical protein